ncbi:hypothetical protein LAT59_00020 [Candidatus Gracilibacteria bacterium]|nr:hypothetical protein [Candidatus Gracilibacteria bacterium]
MKGIQTISEYFGISKEDLESKGVYDRILGFDSRLFVDPFLLKELVINEFNGAEEILRKRIKNIIKLLRLSEEENDIAFRKAAELIITKETKGVGIGYGNDTDDGNSIGPVLAHNIAGIGKKIIGYGIDDPEIFELIGLFQEGFGADRISDFTIGTLETNFLNFTERVCYELGITNIKSIDFKDGNSYMLPYITEQEKYVLFIPQKLLRNLPISQDAENIEHVVEFNKELRDRLNKLVGKDWREYIQTIGARKEHILTEEKYVKDLLSFYKNRPSISYDFINDPLGRDLWLSIGKQFAERFPIQFENTELKSLEDIKNIVRKMIIHFQKLTEHNQLNKTFTKGNGAYDEKYVQRIFLAIADTFCIANNLDLSPESKKSNGPVDFKMSQGNKKVVVETKLSKNDIIKGIAQIEEYEKGEDAYGIYLIIITGDHQTKLERFEEIIDELKEKGKYTPEYFIIDGRLNPTPSNLKLVL